MSTQETKIVHIDCAPTVDRLRYTDTPSRTWTAEDEARRIVKAGCNYSDVAEVMLGLLCELSKCACKRGLSANQISYSTLTTYCLTR
jgi:hypothetical protein